MRGVVLAGGRGERLRSLTGGSNKHLLPVGGRAMIDHPIGALIDAGVTDVLVVTGAEHAEAMRQHLRTTPLAERAALSLVEQAEPAGIADALAGAEAFAAGGPTCVVLGDNIFEKPIAPIAAAFRADPSGAHLLLTESDEPERFACVRFEHDDQSAPIIEIIEKPTTPPSRHIVTGIYFYDASVFDICRSLTPSDRAELEITDVNIAYLNQGRLRHEHLDGWWIDAGTTESLERAEQLLAARERPA